MNLRLAATRWWHRHRRPLTRNRWLFMWLSRRRESRANLLVRPDSALLIEAPMRSGNTFAVAAFWLGNGRDIHVARHVHTAAHVLEAVRLDVPALVLVREPRSVAISHVLRRPALTVQDSLIDYIDFFTTLEKVRDQIVAVDFETLISDFPGVIAVLNDKYGQKFSSRVMDDEFERDVTALVEEMNRAESVSDGKVDELRVARPSAARQELRKGPEMELEHPRNQAALARAMAVYERWK